MSTRPEIMRHEYSRFRDRVVRIFQKVLDLARALANPELVQVSEGLTTNVNAPFLFVVVGEVKAGKSSLINALLGSQVCEVAPDPCTDAIQKIVYAPERRQEVLGEHLKEIGLPEDVLREVAIVDTPGTNSIIERHQALTEGFIPESDLVLFVFSAVNPYSKTSWELFDLVHKSWHKKIVFVLQQADRATDGEIEVHVRRVRELAAQRGLPEALVFTVSARRAMETGRDPGLDGLWEHIRSTVTGGRHYLLKMESLVQTATRILVRLEEDIASQIQTLAEDRREGDKIRQHLDKGRRASGREIEIFRERLLNAYDAETQTSVHEFEEGLSVTRLFGATMKGLFSRKNSLQAWVEDLGHVFRSRLTERIGGVIRESSSGIAEQIITVVEGLLDDLKADQRPGGLAGPRRSDIAGLTRDRFGVIEETTRKLMAMLSNESMADRLRPRDLHKIGDQAVLGGFITTVGAIIATATHAVVFDVTGGIVTTVGALLAINTLVFKRRSVIRRFQEGFATGRDLFQAELSRRLYGQLEAIYRELAEAFSPYFASIEERDRTLARLKSDAAALQAALSEETRRIQDLMPGSPPP